MEAHKEPPQSFSLEGTTMLMYELEPRQPVVGDEVTFLLELIPRTDAPLESDYEVKFHIYADESFTAWDTGEPEDNKRIVLLGSYDGEEVRDGLYTARHVFDTPATYHVAVSVEHDGEVLSKEHHMLLVEPRAPGPLFWSWLGLMLGAVMLGVILKVW